MNDFRVKIRLTAPAGTPWQADTVMGSLAWRIARINGESAVREFIQMHLDHAPPFVLSDGFPEGFVPKPLIPVKKHENRPDFKQYNELKRMKKSTYIPLSEFDFIRKGAEMQPNAFGDPWISHVHTHVSIDRIHSAPAGDGALFQTEVSLLKNNGRLDIYARVNPEWESKLDTLFKSLEAVGFGRDLSTGIGAFKYLGMEKVNAFNEFQGCNGFVSLSTYTPAGSDPVKGWYKLHVKYGKTGGLDLNPFKIPLLQLQPGAAFAASGKLKPFYGTPIQGIAPGNPDVIQFGYCFPVPCLWRDYD